MSKNDLPKVPENLRNHPVAAWSEAVMIDTYQPMDPDQNPMFLEKRVYQGSRGTVYPMAFYNRISQEKSPVRWQAVHLENRFLRIMILPEIGGRIHIALDKTNNYDFIYRQNVIKPALVGLAGPWVSGGIEFNWPQHHRPGTFQPVAVDIEAHDNGSRTVWLSEIDPLNRLKGMHGVCLHPDRAVLEVKVRLYNRTELPQTFLWWANVATRVHERYQSFFPPDVEYVADHAKRAISRFPFCDGTYYGVDYASRAHDGVPETELPRQFVPPGNYPANDLSWYANIPVPTSYMAVGSRQDFFGGYDHKAKAGIVHVADHRIAPGKKQWTWGNQEFGYAWDRNLTDDDGPYIELMAGVFTDNQPDFSHLMPGETRTFSQYWYPIQECGPAHHANLRAAVSLHIELGIARLGVSVTEVLPNARISLAHPGNVNRITVDLAPGRSLVRTFDGLCCAALEELVLTVEDSAGNLVIAYHPEKRPPVPAPTPATEPPYPEGIGSSDELFLTGLHLDQYRHASRSPVQYWQEAIRRDPGDSRSNNALGLWHYQRGERTAAEACFRKTIERLTFRNPNPADGEPFYNLGLVLRDHGEMEQAYDNLAKATWNQAWVGPACLALAEIDCQRGEWQRALDHLDRVIRINPDNLNARGLRILVLRKLTLHKEAENALVENRQTDSLDAWGLFLSDQPLPNTQIHLDFALDLGRAGFFAEALSVLAHAQPEPLSGTNPMVDYYRGYFWAKSGKTEAALAAFMEASQADSRYCFPARLAELTILETALQYNPDDAKAAYYLGNLLYDRQRHREAIGYWETSVRIDPTFSVAWRNLGIAWYNLEHKASKAKAAYKQAVRLAPHDARVVYEQDQLWKRIGIAPHTRLSQLKKHLTEVNERDDLTLEYCALLNQTARSRDALAILNNRRFQPWEGGEGMAIGQFVRTHLILGRAALDAGDAALALEHFDHALENPENLGEAKHLLVNSSDIQYWRGQTLSALGKAEEARKVWESVGHWQGDFQNMSVRRYSEMTYFQILALQSLGETERARDLARSLLRYAKELAAVPAKIDYFATSLPTLLLFADNLSFRQQITAQFLRCQALFTLGKRSEAKRLLTRVLTQDPNHPMATDLAREMGL